MLSKELEVSLNAAYKKAADDGYNVFTIGHLMLVLFSYSKIIDVLAFFNVNKTKLCEKIEKIIYKKTSNLSSKRRQIAQSIALQRVFQRAVFKALSDGLYEVGSEHLLIAALGEHDDKIIKILEKENIVQGKIENYFSQHNNQKTKNPENFFENKSNTKSALDQFAVDLNKLVLSGKVEPVVGRDDEISRAVEILNRKTKNNPLLVGEPGVGKTAIVYGLADLIVKKKVNASLHESTIYSLDIGSIVSGTRYRGDFEERMKSIVDELKDRPDSILFIDEIHNIVGAGATEDSTMDISNMIKPLLSNGELKCIGATTYSEYRSSFGKDKALARRFQKIDIEEPSEENTIVILKKLKISLEKYHGVKYTDDAIVSAVNLSSRFINNRFFPDKAIDVLDEAGARLHVFPGTKQSKIVDTKEIESVIAKMAHIPRKNISRNDKIVLRNLENDLKNVIFGQDEAIHVLVSAIKLSKCGLRDGSKPIGSFLFAGPTGVGKTEVSKQLADFLGINFLRFDMSEYNESHTVSKLIGAPPGYVGYDKGGLLSIEISKHPHCVLLLDEFEKANPEIHNIMLQVMDNGFLTDNNGEKIDFRHAIIIMTMNSKDSSISQSDIGFISNSKKKTKSISQFEKMFSPEFINRLDAIVQFAPLNMTTIAHVVNKLISELTSQLKEHNVSIQVSDNARMWLATHGYDEKYGARPMARLIQEKIKLPLADQLLFGKLSHGGKAKVLEKNGELIINC